MKQGSSARVGVLNTVAQSVNVYLNRVRFRHQIVRVGESAGTVERRDPVQAWFNHGLGRGLHNVKIKVVDTINKRTSVMDPRDFLLVVTNWFPGATPEVEEALGELANMVTAPLWSADIQALAGTVGLKIS